MSLRDKAIKQLQQLAGREDEVEAGKIVDAIEAAAGKEALEVLAGEASPPSSSAEARVTRLTYICRELDGEGVGPLSDREIGVALRVPVTTARNTKRLLMARDPELLATGLREQVAEGKARKIEGTMEAEATYEITLPTPEALEFAAELLRRAGLTRGLQIRKAQQVLVIPQELEDRQGTKRNPLDQLGVTKP